MGQEHSSVSLYSSSSQTEFNTSKYREKEYSDCVCRGYKKPLRQQKSTDSFKSDISSTESSGYRSGSNSASEKSSTESDYSRVSLYRNGHYKDRNRDLYKPVKLSKETLYKLKYLDPEKNTSEYLEKHLSIKSYQSTSEKQCEGAVMKEKASKGIRNYTPKILSEDQKGKTIDDWI